MTTFTNNYNSNTSKTSNNIFSPHPCSFFDIAKVDAPPLDRFDHVDFENPHKEDFRMLIRNIQCNEALYEIFTKEDSEQRTVGFAILRIQFYKEKGHYGNVVMLRSLIKNENIHRVGYFSFSHLGKFMWEEMLNDFLDYVAVTTQATMILGSFINNKELKELFGTIYDGKHFRKPTFKEKIFLRRRKILPPNDTTLMVRNM